QTFIRQLRVSRYYETAPVGVSGPQPLYLNAAAVGDTLLPPRELLDALLAVEHERGRARPRPLAPRTLDLDLVPFGDLAVEEAGVPRAAVRPGAARRDRAGADRSGHVTGGQGAARRSRERVSVVYAFRRTKRSGYSRTLHLDRRRYRRRGTGCGMGCGSGGSC